MALAKAARLHSHGLFLASGDLYKLLEQLLIVPLDLSLLH